jgi:hypothetical protein
MTDIKSYYGWYKLVGMDIELCDTRLDNVLSHVIFLLTIVSTCKGLRLKAYKICNDNRITKKGYS